jgi:hypothetical protein
MGNRRTRPLYDTRQKKKVFGKLIFVLLLVLVLSGVTMAVNNALATRKSYMKDIKLLSVGIKSKVVEDGKYYIQILPGTDMYDIKLSDDDTWIEVASAFYNKHQTSDTVGVLLGNYDVYKEKLIGNKMILEKSYWSLDEIYDSLDEAKSQNAYRKYTAPASIEKKKVFESGNHYFKLKNEERVFTLKVSKNVYDKYNEKQNINCQFEGYGDFVKLISLVE